MERELDGGTGKRCPLCEKGELMNRQGPKVEFIGCSNYPKCHYIDFPHSGNSGNGHASTGEDRYGIQEYGLIGYGEWGWGD